MYAAILAICLAGSAPSIDSNQCVTILLGSTETYEECRARGKELVEDGESMKIIMPKVKEAFGDEAELEYHVGCLKSEDV